MFVHFIPFRQFWLFSGRVALPDAQHWEDIYFITLVYLRYTVCATVSSIIYHTVPYSTVRYRMILIWSYDTVHDTRAPYIFIILLLPSSRQEFGPRGLPHGVYLLPPCHQLVKRKIPLVWLHIRKYTRNDMFDRSLLLYPQSSQFFCVSLLFPSNQSNASTHASLFLVPSPSCCLPAM